MTDASICIFARNEALHLPRAVFALNAAAGDLSYRVHILVNGCTDETFDVAKVLAAADPRIAVHELPVGDKSHAWNEYVHRIAGNERCHIFLDGDIRPGKGAIEALATLLSSKPLAYGAAALPASGRSQNAWSARLKDNHYLSGNLYALSLDAIAEFRRRSIHLPFGAKGEDGLISYLLLTDFEGGLNASATHRIEVADEAAFEFDSLSLNLRDLMIYRRRLQRYSERHFQKALLYPRLKKYGVAAMPDNVYEIYSDHALKKLRPRNHPLNFWFDFATLQRLRRKIYIQGL